jgi:aryl-alcohol dehydrogenase-like predicted oxidoreductase
MHWPAEDGAQLDDYWGELLKLKEEGKIRAAGLSNHSMAQLEAADVLGHVDTLQPPFPAIRRDRAPEIAWCGSHATGVIVYSPMQAGLLTGSFSAERASQLHEDDWRARSPMFQGEQLARTLALADAMRPVAERKGTTVAAIAVAWALSWPGVTGAIVGARSPSQVEGWLPAADLELSREDLDQVAGAIEATGSGEGPIRQQS